MKVFWQLLPAAALLFLAGAAQASDALVRKGEIIATDACSACHKVGPYQHRPGPVFNDVEQEDVLAPTFAEIGKRYGYDRRYLRRAITSPKHPMREQDWDEADLKAVIAYLQSLRKRAPARKPIPH